MRPDAQATCLTCGDVAVPARIVEVVGDTATVEIAGTLEQVGIELVGPVAAGDVVLCHAGIALTTLTSAL